MATVSIFGSMGADMKVITLTIRSMVLECTLGLMGELIKVTGTRANSTGKADTFCKTATRKLDYGNMVRG